eukprot:TRINITY_DN3748_c0_g1_i1.p1 TRINITY_DN3748_c0_g1~~TRINITY_DN3748_c0_g1_i1.p1  ORF type:complete len:381 (+),score=83.21 TRINITY_DN3748_c0_g1_i1:285-1427(+)
MMDSEQGKLFVGGISWETKEETLSDHFDKYGEVVESVVMRDRMTGSARGFGFVLFSDPSAADKALHEKHVILGRTVEVKKAVPKGEQHHQHQHQHPHQLHNKGSSRNGSSSSGSNTNGSGIPFRTKKIFVGGLSSNLTEEAFKSYFQKFGNITDVVVMYDNITQRPRGFGFITFDSEEAVENVMQKSFHELNDKLVEVKRAVPKDGSNGSNGNNNSNHNFRMGSGRGSGFGLYQGGFYPPYSPRYEFFHGYAPVPISGYGNSAPYPYGIYPFGGYNGVGYGTPIVPPRSPWNGMGMVGAQRSPMPFGTAGIYPSYVNGGFVGESSGAYSGVGGASNGKLIQSGTNVQTTTGGSYGGTPGTTPPHTEGGTLENDAYSFRLG